MVLITGYAGFIGVNFIFQWLKHRVDMVVYQDALTYVSSQENLHKQLELDQSADTGDNR